MFTCKGQVFFALAFSLSLSLPLCVCACIHARVRAHVPACVCSKKGGRQLTQTQQHITSSVNQATGEVKGKEETGTLPNHFVIKRQNKTKQKKKCLSEQCRLLPELT